MDDNLLQIAQNKLTKDPSQLADWLSRQQNWWGILMELTQCSPDPIPTTIQEGIRSVVVHHFQQAQYSEALQWLYCLAEWDRPLMTLIAEAAMDLEDQGQSFDICIELREAIVLWQSNNIDNLLMLVTLSATIRDQDRVQHYTQVAINTIQNLSSSQPQDFSFYFSYPLRQLFHNEYLSQFFELAIASTNKIAVESEQPSIYGILHLLSFSYYPTLSEKLSKLYEFPDLLRAKAFDVIDLLFTKSKLKTNLRGYVALAEGFEFVASQTPPEDIQTQLPLLSEALIHYTQASQSTQARSLINQIVGTWSWQSLSELIPSTPEQALKENKVHLFHALTFRTCFVLPYLTDDQALIRHYQQVCVKGVTQSYVLHPSAMQKIDRFDHFQRRQGQDFNSRPLRVGYLGSCFRLHSVGFLSYQAITQHDPQQVQTYCYSVLTPHSAEDTIYRAFRDTTHRFYDLNDQPLRVIFETIVRDDLDILVLMDASTTKIGFEVLPFRPAWIQMSWLGGDSPAIPELDYFLADPYVLRDDAQSDYEETILRLPTFAAVDDFMVGDVDPDRVRQALGIPDKDIIFWTAANAMKRSHESIQAHLQILKAVPNSVLVIKGIGDQAAVQSLYTEQARSMGIEHKLRFSAMAQHVDFHRAQLAAADLILDTFPYTGATHTFESLYVGTPVLTLVGNHYYGRMSYSLLKNCGLEDCITFSQADYIQRGIDLALNPAYLTRVRQQIEESKSTSVLWNAKAFSGSLEAIYRQAVEETWTSVRTDNSNLSQVESLDPSIVQQAQQLLTQSSDQFSEWLSTQPAWWSILKTLSGYSDSQAPETPHQGIQVIGVWLIKQENFTEGLPWLRLLPTPNRSLSQQLINIAISHEDVRELDKALQTREIALEWDPYTYDNLAYLIGLSSTLEDDFRVSIYVQALMESWTMTPKPPSPPMKSILAMAVSQLLERDYTELFFDLLSNFAQFYISEPSEKKGFLCVLTVLAKTYLPEFTSPLEGQWDPMDLTNPIVRDILLIFKTSGAKASSLVADELEAAAAKISQGSTQEIEAQFFLLASALEYNLQSSQHQKAKDILNSILNRWPTDSINSLAPQSKDHQSSYRFFFELVFKICFHIPYLTDDMELIRAYQKAAEGGLSRFKLYSYQELWSDPPTKLSLERPIRIGYMGIAFRKHAVGFLSHETILHHNSENFQVYCYDICDEEFKYDDPIRNQLKSNVHIFRDLKNRSWQDTLLAIREDAIDILIYMDASTNIAGHHILPFRPAPIQMSWLGGDSPSIAELDYFIVDPHILPPKAERLYQEKLLRLPTFAAVDSFTVSELDYESGRYNLNVSLDAVLFWTSANAAKRSPESIEAQLEIIKQVPDSILAIKGLGDASAVSNAYYQIAKEKGVQDRLRFVKATQLEENHRAQLTIADLVLDTFPYTGATHTFEALYVGTPVLTLVGRHYYGRMSYSLLKNCQLEDCITHSIDEYIQRGIQLGSDREYLARVKAQVRASRATSPIWDAQGFARSLEATYRQVIEAKLKDQQGS